MKYAAPVLALFTLGLLSMSVQVIFIREFLALFEGNELVIGICLGTWMIFTAAGATLAAQWKKERRHEPAVAILFTLATVLPLLMIWALAWLRISIAPAGVSPGFFHLIGLLVTVMGPFCLLSGLLFPLLAAGLPGSHAQHPAQTAYGLDSAGSIAGGALFSLVFIFLFRTSWNLALLSVLCLPAAVWLVRTAKGRTAAMFAGIIIVAGAMTYLASDCKKPVIALFFPGQEVIQSKDTPLGRLTLTMAGGQLNLYENSTPVALEGDITANEESVHYAMLLHPDPRRVLMISGGLTGALAEVQKYPVERIDYLEFNPWLIRMIAPFRETPEEDRLHLIIHDPARYLRDQGPLYDVILVNTPDPRSAASNRFYTQEFFSLLKSRLEPGGIISCSVPAAGHYMSEPSRVLHSVILVTLKKVFSQVRIIPGQRDYYLATNGAFNRSFWENYERFGISNQYVHPGYIHEGMLEARSAGITEALITEPPVNSNLHPYVYRQMIRKWTDQFRVDLRIIPGILLFVILLVFIFSGPISLGLFSAGFTVSSLEFILIIWLQVLYGHVYQMLGLVFAVFMAGMVAGSVFTEKFFRLGSFRGFLINQSALGIFSVLIATMMMLFPPHADDWLIITLLSIMVAYSGFAMGIHFALGVNLRKDQTVKSAGESFGADLVGSAIGMVLVSVYVLPLVGLPATAAMLSLLNILVVAVIIRRRKIQANPSHG